MKKLKIEDLSIEQKIGQLLVVRRFLSDADREFIYDMVKNKCVGGIQFEYYKGCEKEIEKNK